MNPSHLSRNKAEGCVLRASTVWLVIFLAAAGPAAAAGEMRTVAGGEVATLCLPAADPAQAELRAGTRRAVLVVHAYAPGASGAGLAVALPETGATGRIGLFPGVGFGVDAEPRRYMLPRATGAGEGALCYEVRVEGGADARLSLSIEVSPPLR